MNMLQLWMQKSKNEQAWTVTGAALMLLALVGLFLPLVPQVPFAILASFCFSRGSPRLHRWMRGHRAMGRPVCDWEDHKVIRNRLKIVAVIGMSVACAICYHRYRHIYPGFTIAFYCVMLVSSFLVMTRASCPGQQTSIKPWIFLGILGLVIIFYLNGGKEALSFEALKGRLWDLQQWYAESPVTSVLIFFGCYVGLTALSIPGSLVLTLLAGAIYGTWMGLLLVAVAGTLGALLAFLMARYLLKDYVEGKFSRQFTLVNKNLKKDGVIYLFILRMIPVSPFVVINLVMGVTTLSWFTFSWTTLVSMIPGNLLYVYAGRKIGELKSPSDIMTAELILALTALGLFPLLVKKLLSLRKRKLLHG